MSSKSLRAVIDLYQTLGEALIRATGKSVMTKAEMEWERGASPPKIGKRAAVRVSMPNLEDLFFSNATRKFQDACRPAEVSWSAMFFITPSRCPVPSKCRQAPNTKEKLFKN
jgi:hypothetical protein